MTETERPSYWVYLYDTLRNILNAAIWVQVIRVKPVEPENKMILFWGDHDFPSNLGSICVPCFLNNQTVKKIPRFTKACTLKLQFSIVHNHHSTEAYPIRLFFPCQQRIFQFFAVKLEWPSLAAKIGKRGIKSL